MPGPQSPSHLDANHTTIWTLSAGVFYDRHEVDIPPQGASFTDNVIFLDGYLQARAGYQRIPITLDGIPAYYIDLYRPILSTNDRNGSLIVVKRTATGVLTVHLLELTEDCDDAGVPISDTLIGTVPNAAIPAYYQLDPTGNTLLSVFDTTGNPNYAVGGAPNTINASSTNFKGNWYLASGDDDIFRYDGTNFLPLRTLQPNPDLQNPIGARIITSNDARLFIANCVDPSSGIRVPYRIAWSSTLEDNRWGGSEYQSGTASFIDLAGENDPITALYTSSDFVVVFKPRTIYVGQFVGPSQYYSFRRLVRGPGCVSHATLVEYRDGLLVWLGDDNVYMGLPGQKPQPIGNAIEDRIRVVADLCRMDEARADIDRDNHIYTMYLPIKNDLNIHDQNTTVQNYKIFSCHIPTQGWFEGNITSDQVNVMSTIETRTNWWTTNIYVASYDGQIYAKDLSYKQDHNSDFPCDYVTGLFSYERVTDAATQQASVQAIRVHATEGEVDLLLTTTNNLDRPQEAFYGTQTSDGAKDSDILVTKRDKTAEHFKVRVRNDVGRNFGKVAAISVSAIAEGDTRKLR